MTDDESASPPPPPSEGSGSAVPEPGGVQVAPGWYSIDPKSNTQTYWDGAHWSKTRTWRLSNFEPLTGTADGGPYLASVPSTANYVVEYDGSGNVWVAPAGSWGTTFDPTQSLEDNPQACAVASTN